MQCVRLSQGHAWKVRNRIPVLPLSALAFLGDREAPTWEGRTFQRGVGSVRVDTSSGRGTEDRMKYNNVHRSMSQQNRDHAEQGFLRRQRIRPWRPSFLEVALGCLLVAMALLAVLGERL